MQRLVCSRLITHDTSVALSKKTPWFTFHLLHLIKYVFIYLSSRKLKRFDFCAFARWCLNWATLKKFAAQAPGSIPTVCVRRKFLFKNVLNYAVAYFFTAYQFV